MKTEYKLLHLEMLQDMDRCLQLELPERERAESCFWIASNYWEKLKELMQGRTFKDDNEEIDFFRNVKPEFTSWMEYFVILSEALLFVPVEKLTAIAYWEEESVRFKRFCNKNNQFISYYESNDRHMDSNYFLRKGAEDLKYVVNSPVYDVDTTFCTSHDPLVRAYLAQKKFHDYVLKKIAALKESK